MRVPGRRGRLLAAGLIGGCVLAGIAHRVLRWAAYWGWGRIETPLDVIPTACFGAGAGLAAGLVLYATGARLLGASPASVPDAPATPPPAAETRGRAASTEHSRQGSR